MIAVSRKPHLKIAPELCSKNLMTEQPMEKCIEFCSRHMRLWLMYRVFSSIKCHLLCGLALKFHKFVYTNAKVTCKITCCTTEKVELLSGNLTHCGLNQNGFIFLDRSLPSTCESITIIIYFADFLLCQMFDTTPQHQLFITQHVYFHVLFILISPAGYFFSIMRE